MHDRSVVYVWFLLLSAADVATARAQTAPPPIAQDTATAAVPAASPPAPDVQSAAAPATAERPMRHHTSALLPLGIALGAGSYVVSAGVGLVYLVLVFPFQAAFGNDKAEPTALWLLLPIVGPFMAQKQELVRGESGWRGVLIADGVLQSTGLVLIIAGIALSGRRPDDSPERAGLQLLPGTSSSPLGLTLRLRAF